MGLPSVNSMSLPRAKIINQLYEAETASEGFRLFLRLFPCWVPPVAMASGCVAYGLSIVIRLHLARWRISQRRRAQRTYALLQNLRGIHNARGGGGGSTGVSGSLAYIFSEEDEEDDEEEGGEEDKTAVSVRDINEFRSSLGVLLPRDEDLLTLLERLLVEDPIPEGWVLYRTTAGIIRFMNQNTQELSFFHPLAEPLKEHIEYILRLRNGKTVEEKYPSRTGLEAQTSASLDMGSRSSSHFGGKRGSPFESNHLYPWSTVFSSSGSGSGSGVLGDGNAEDTRGSGFFGETSSGGAALHARSGSHATASWGSPNGTGVYEEGSSGNGRNGNTRKATELSSVSSGGGNVPTSSGVAGGGGSNGTPSEGLTTNTSSPSLHAVPSDSGASPTGGGSGSNGGQSSSQLHRHVHDGYQPPRSRFSMARRAINYFLQREQQKIIRDVIEESKKATEPKKAGEVSLSDSDLDACRNSKKEHKLPHESGGRVFFPVNKEPLQTG